MNHGRRSGTGAVVATVVAVAALFVGAQLWSSRVRTDPVPVPVRPPASVAPTTTATTAPTAPTTTAPTDAPASEFLEHLESLIGDSPVPTTVPTPTSVPVPADDPDTPVTDELPFRLPDVFEPVGRPTTVDGPPGTVGFRYATPLDARAAVEALGRAATEAGFVATGEVEELGDGARQWFLATNDRILGLRAHPTTGGADVTVITAPA